MRPYRRGEFAKVRLHVDVIVPCTDDLHLVQRFSSHDYNSRVSTKALEWALSDAPEFSTYRITDVVRGKYIGSGYSDPSTLDASLPSEDAPAATPPATVSSTEDSETPDSSDAASPSDSDAPLAESDAARWDFVVA